MKILGLQFSRRSNAVMAGIDLLFIAIWVGSLPAILLGSFAADGAWVALFIFGWIGVGDIRFRWNRIQTVWADKEEDVGVTE